MKRSQCFGKPYRIKRKKPVLKNRFFKLGILTLVLAGGIFYLVCFASFFQIKEISISGCQKTQAQEVEKTIKEQAAKKILFLDTSSIFLVNSEKISAEIIKNFPQIEKADLKRSWPDKLTVKIEERKPAAVLCQNEKCFYVDKNCIVYEEIIEENYLGPKVKNETLLSEIKLGEIVFEADLMTKIIKINSRLTEDLQINPEEFDVLSEQRLNVKTSGEWKIYFNLKSDIDWQIAQLKAILQNKIPPENQKKLEYIDLRFDRIFVSPKGLIVD